MLLFCLASRQHLALVGAPGIFYLKRQKAKMPFLRTNSVLYSKGWKRYLLINGHFGFAGHTPYVVTTSLSLCSMKAAIDNKQMKKAAIDNKQMNECGYVLIKLYL